MKYDEKGLNRVLTDPNFSDVGNLPSNFFPYEFKSLYIRPFTVQELRLISKAAALDEMQHVVRAVNLCISEDASELTTGDFYYLLMWLKIHSTPKTPYVVEWHCKERVYWKKEVKDVPGVPDSPRVMMFNDNSFQVPKPEDMAQYEILPCTCHNSEVIHLTNLEIIQLPETSWEGLPEGFDFPRARNLQEIRDLLKDPELRLIVGPAQWIAEGKTVAEKIAYLESLPDLDMFYTAEKLNETIVHGIRETTVLHCRECRASHPFDIQLEPYNFFR